VGLDNLSRLNEIYHDGTIIEKRQVIGSVYPEKLSFDGDRLRTTRINEAVRVIYTLDKALEEKENRTRSLRINCYHHRYHRYFHSPERKE
jgi:site-specific DNA recombinase